MPGLSGAALEEYGKNTFINMGFLCVNPLNQVQLNVIKPSAPFHNGEHFEFDYLIPIGDTCIIGEITSRSIPQELKDKYSKYRRNFDFLSSLNLCDPNIWKLIGVDDRDIGNFLGMTHIKGLFISTELLFFDAPLQKVPEIVCFYKSDWNQLVNYSECIGKYARNLFTDTLNINNQNIRRPLEIRKIDHKLIRTSNVKISDETIGLADIFTFEASPYELLPLARVFRYDLLPCIDSSLDKNYQRPLITEKILKIRNKLLTNQSFIFPNSILIVLSPDSTFLNNEYLRIPDYYGSLAIIDGQHRLFSYANDIVYRTMGDQCKILVSAIKFQTINDSEIQKFSAKTFIEINSTQTPVKSTHIDAIAFPILDEIYPRTIAAQIILRINEKVNSKLFGIFDTSQTNFGKIKTTTVLTALQSTTNIVTVQSLVSAQRGKKGLQKQGYENLFGCPINDLVQPECLIEKGSVALERFFSIVATIFRYEWIKRDRTTNSSFEYTKFISAFIKLFNSFVLEGLDWNEVRVQVENIKNNVMLLRGLTSYTKNDVIFDVGDTKIPDSSHSMSKDFKFINLNRSAPTSVENL